MISVCKRFTFEAAHRLPNHVGQCKHLHGHSYKLEVEVTGPIITADSFYKSQEGMIVDFGLLKEIINKYILAKVDHRCLNDLYPNPTAEIMVESFAKVLEVQIKAYNNFSLKLLRVRLWETENSYAEWRAE